ncbi:MAG: gfo/Idh/MocA family oxidoreductase [Spirochaetaceae bacterium]|nr:MAG: gfo/Idh/MocA family oxidoreductase [Spirochaetaceae bacterium]
MTQESKIRVGVIGAGFIGRVHLDTFGKMPNVELAGICDAVPGAATAAATAHGVRHVFSEPAEMIGSEEIDVIVVAVPNRFHTDLAVAALDAGKHVLLEKPMAIDGTAARRIVEAQKSSRRTLMVAHQMRWSAMAREAKRQVETGELGKVYNGKAVMMRRKAIPGWGSWFTRKSESGGGPLIDIGVHMLDLGMWLMGSPKPISVFGSVYAEFGPEKRGTGRWGTPDWNGVFDVEDLATALIKLDTGATLSLEVSWAVNTDSDSGHQIHLMGTEGGLSVYPKRVVYTGQKFDRAFDVEVPSPADEENPRELMTRHFLECVRTGETPISDAVSGLANNLVLDAIYASAKTGESVSVSL